MKGIVLLISILISNFLFSQKIASNVLKYYEFKFCDSPQSLVLIEKRNSKYLGYIHFNLKKEKGNKSYKKIKKRIKISSEQTEKLILELKKAEIDSLNRSYDDDKEFYLDGDYLVIKLLQNNKIEKYVFDETYPVSSKKIEKTPLRGKIQSWLSIIDNELNIKEQFSKVKSKLSRGTYCYDSGISTLCFKKK